MTDLIKYIPVIVAVVLLGNWLLAEMKKARRQAAPWYRPYLSPPAVCIALILLALIVVRIRLS